MQIDKKVEDCALMLSNKVGLDITLGPDSSGLSNINTSVFLNEDIQLPVYWLPEKDMLAKDVLAIESVVTHRDKLVIASPTINGRIANQWRKLGLQYMDAAGNASIHIQGYHIVSVGHQPAAAKASIRPVDGKTGKSFQPSGLKVIFSLLNNEELVSSSLRAISEYSGVSLGSTSAAYKDLLAHGFIRKQGEHTELRNKQQLIERWAEAYPYQVRNKKLIGHFTSDDPSWWKKVEGLAGFQWGGEVAAKELSNYLNPKDGLVYLSKDNQSNFIRTARLRKLKDKERPEFIIDLYEAFWNLDESRIVAPPLIVYSDLMETGDARNLDAANRIYDEFLD